MATTTTAKDPVCGMHVDTSENHPTSQHQGDTYHFCCNACKDKFDEAPAMYAARKTAD